MEKAYRSGKLKAIGVVNFYPFILVNFCETVDVKPAVDHFDSAVQKMVLGVKIH